MVQALTLYNLDHNLDQQEHDKRNNSDSSHESGEQAVSSRALFIDQTISLIIGCVVVGRIHEFQQEFRRTSLQGTIIEMVIRVGQGHGTIFKQVFWKGTLVEGYFTERPHLFRRHPVSIVGKSGNEMRKIIGIEAIEKELVTICGKVKDTIVCGFPLFRVW